MSGFVYKVRVDGEILIKKEIPGPDTIDEFLYEINALTRLRFSQDVIRFHGVVVDDDYEHVKGLLISYAAKGALIDIIFEHSQEHRPDLPWPTREKWARQIIQGLADIHESGFVQGDFTLSNIVIDEYDNAKIIDINRRGCPVGWEPPEATALTESNQRIFMYIGVKSDLFQLGMVLWALAMQIEEPENQRRPLRLPPGNDDGIPGWYRRVVESCLDPDPRRRLHASRLLSLVPDGLDSDDDELIEVVVPHAPMAPAAAEYGMTRSTSGSSSGSSGSVDSQAIYDDDDSEARSRQLHHSSTYPGAYPYPFNTYHFPAPDSQIGRELSPKYLSGLPFDSFIYAHKKQRRGRRRRSFSAGGIITGYGGAGQMMQRKRDYSTLTASGPCWNSDGDDDQENDDEKENRRPDGSDDGESKPDLDLDVGDGIDLISATPLMENICAQSLPVDGDASEISADCRFQQGDDALDEEELADEVDNNSDTLAGTVVITPSSPRESLDKETALHHSGCATSPPVPLVPSAPSEAVSGLRIMRTGRPWSDPGDQANGKEQEQQSTAGDGFHGEPRSFHDLSGLLFGIRTFEEVSVSVPFGRSHSLEVAAAAPVQQCEGL